VGMRVLSLILVLLLISLRGFVNTTVSLRMTTNLGFHRNEAVEIENAETVYYNGQKIPSKNLANIKPALDTLLLPPKEKAKSCHSGYYQYVLSRAGKEQKYRGCNRGSEYARLAVAFGEIKKQSRGKKR